MSSPGGPGIVNGCTLPQNAVKHHDSYVDIFSVKTNIALTAVRSRVRESLASHTANLILFTLYFLLKLTHFLVKSAFRQFMKYISEIMKHSKLKEPIFKLEQTPKHNECKETNIA